MEPSAVRAAADLLQQAYRSGTPIAPLIDEYPDADVTDAYRVQQEQVRRWTQAGDTVRGHKVGLASAAMQRQMGVSQPDYGHLLGDMFHLEHQPIPAQRFLQPRIEPEIAFVLGRRLSGPGVTVADAIRAVDFVLPALEVVDSRITDWRISIVDTIADNASSGGVVLGSTATPLSQVDVRLVGGVLYRNEEVVGTGSCGAVLGSPLNALVWLANVLGRRGVTLEAGHVVLPGAITAAVRVAAGDVARATFAGLGSVTARFSKEGGVR